MRPKHWIITVLIKNDTSKMTTVRKKHYCTSAEMSEYVEEIINKKGVTETYGGNKIVFYPPSRIYQVVTTIDTE